VLSSGRVHPRCHWWESPSMHPSVISLYSHSSKTVPCMPVRIRSASPTTIPLPHCLLLKHIGDVMLTSCLSNNNSLYLSTCTNVPLACMPCDL
jgi:hypothetical protein